MTNNEQTANGVN